MKYKIKNPITTKKLKNELYDNKPSVGENIFRVLEERNQSLGAKIKLSGRQEMDATCKEHKK